MSVAWTYRILGTAASFTVGFLCALALAPWGVQPTVPHCRIGTCWGGFVPGTCLYAVTATGKEYEVTRFNAGSGLAAVTLAETMHCPLDTQLAVGGTTP